MTKQSTDTRALFNFYTYNPVGRDVVIPVRGVDEADAWNTFEKLYMHNADGTVNPVDQVIKVND